MPQPRAQTSKRRLIADRAARWIVSAGGIAIIASILGILIFIVVEVFPLVLPAGVDAAVLSDDYRTHVATLDEHGVVRVERLSDGKVVYTTNLPVPSLTAAAVPPQSKAFAAATADGRVLVKSMGFTVTFQGSERVVTPDETPPVFLDLDPEKRPLAAFAAQIDADGNVMAAGALADGKLAVARQSVE